MSEWTYVPGPIKALHMVGRTCPRLQPQVSAIEVEALHREHGSVWSLRGMSESQCLDLIASAILRRDRRRRAVAEIRKRSRPLRGDRCDWKDDGMLSLTQADDRAKRELPFPDMDVLCELREIIPQPIKRVGRYWYHGGREIRP